MIAHISSVSVPVLSPPTSATWPTSFPLSRCAGTDGPHVDPFSNHYGVEANLPPARNSSGMDSSHVLKDPGRCGWAT